jgi:hypothetical protein
MRRLLLAVAVCVIAVPAGAHAQRPAARPERAVQAPVSGPGVVRGSVQSAATGAAVAAASVAVRRAADSVLVTGALTAADGAFRLRGLPVGRYEVQVSTLGYRTAVRRVAVTAAAPDVQLGTVRLAVSAVALEGLTVTGQKRQVVLTPDRNTFSVKDMPATQGGTAIDVLRNVPGVDVDIDNVVSLRGNDNVVVQIDGRPSPMKGSQLGDFLAQLPANTVEKVAVVPNPSAKYEPEGIAGIIDIQMKKQTDLGTSGGISAGGGTTGQLAGSGNVGFQRGPLSLYGSYGFLRDRRPRTESLFRQNLYLDPLTYLDETTSRTDWPRSHTLNGNASYKLGSGDELGANVLFSTRGGARDYTILYRDLNAARALTDLRDQLATGDHGESSFEGALSHKHAFGAKEHSLSTELRADISNESGTTGFTRDSMAVDGSLLGSPQREDQRTGERPRELSLKTDYTRPLGAHARLEAGYKETSSGFRTTLDTDVFSDVANAFLPDTTRTNAFSYRQLVHAGYGLLHLERGRLAVEPGLRLEHTSTRFGATGQTDEFRGGYSSFFPSALIAFTPDDAHEVTLSYSKRIRRPDDVDLLDPTIHYQDPLNLSRGNPDLKPEYIHALELGLQRSDSRSTLQLTPFFRRTVNAVRRIRTIDDLGVATTTFANVSTSDAYGTDFEVALRQGSLTGFAGASAFRQVSDAANLGAGYSAHTYGWTGRANLTAHATPLLDVQTLLSYRSPMTQEQGRSSARTMLNLALRQKLPGDRASLTLRVVDVLNTNTEGFTTIDPRFYQESDRRVHARGVFLGFNYMFGKPPKEHRPDTLDLPEPAGGG